MNGTKDMDQTEEGNKTVLTGLQDWLDDAIHEASCGVQGKPRLECIFFDGTGCNRPDSEPDECRGLAKDEYGRGYLNAMRQVKREIEYLEHKELLKRRSEPKKKPVTTDILSAMNNICMAKNLLESPEPRMSKRLDREKEILEAKYDWAGPVR